MAMDMRGRISVTKGNLNVTRTQSSYEKDISQRSAESYGLFPDPPVSSYREILMLGSVIMRTHLLCMFFDAPGFGVVELGRSKSRFNINAIRKAITAETPGINTIT